MHNHKVFVELFVTIIFAQRKQGSEPLWQGKALIFVLKHLAGFRVYV